MNDPYPSEGAASPPADDPYPVQYDVEYPDRQLNRLTTFFRLIVVIPIAIVLGMISGSTYGSTGGDAYIYGATAGGFLVGGPLLMILFRKKYPRWWFDWNLELSRFTGRVYVYLSLLDDSYPSTDEQQALRLEIRYPNAETELNRFLPLVKWFLAMPHYIVLFLLSIGALLALVLAWFAILFTGRYPKGLFEYIVGVHRWAMRVTAYAFLLTTDRYPPFRLAP